MTGTGRLVGPLHAAAYGRGLPREGQNMRARATMCYAGISSRTGGNPLPRSRCETGRKLDFDRQGMSIGATGLAALRSRFRAL
jgi:hypothetical protein